MATRNNRDDFSQKTKRTLALRVGYRCSRPDCRRLTSGPTSVGPDGVAQLGDAAHITAASPGGCRYDATLTQEQRGGAGNGIWLCTGCARLIDQDANAYPEALLRDWKLAAEECARAENHATANNSAAPRTTSIVRLRNLILDSPPSSFRKVFDQGDVMQFVHADDVLLAVVVDADGSNFEEPWIRCFPANGLPPTPAERVAGKDSADGSSALLLRLVVSTLRADRFARTDDADFFMSHLDEDESPHHVQRSTLRAAATISSVALSG